MFPARNSHLDDAWRIVSDLLEGRLSLDEVEGRVAHAGAPALKARVGAMRRQFMYSDTGAYERRIAELVTGLTRKNGRRVPFERFASVLGAELAGLVVTAHPTFSLSPRAADTARKLMGAHDTQTGDERRTCSGENAMHRAAAPTLEEELEASTAAVAAIRCAVRRLLAVAVEVAAREYPEDYRRLRPRLVTVATWVGFDLDGRTDIGWRSSLECRYHLALTGIEALAAALSQLRSDAPSQGAAPALDAIEANLSRLSECFRAGAAALRERTGDGARLGRLNRRALENRERKRSAAAGIDAAFAELTALEDLPDALARSLLVLRAEWEMSGIGLSRLHFRLNSVQLHNAIRPDIALERAPGRSTSRRHYLARITHLLDEVSPVNIHYGTVAREQTTAKRIFMLAAQFAKHFDERVPVRLLIAESDTPFTLLVALYYARLFDVERQLEISPLFETPTGLHHGDRVIGELLDNAHFVDYLKRRGRFCVQLGFSDSGRYIGQPAASLAIERFKLRLVRLWKERGLERIQLLFFDTHGESIGRGAHPGSLCQRFDYVHPPEVRHRLDEDVFVPHKHEVSFQGGEGYLWFATEQSAFAVVSELLMARLAPAPETRDALYSHPGWGLDFFLTLKEYQQALTEHPGYLELIDSIGARLLYPTGSRASQRPGGGSARIERLSALRAIPNNAVLHQLAYLLNSCAGLGRAAGQAPDAFQSVLEGSQRLQDLLSLALAARGRSDITMLEAYVQLTSAGFWLDRMDPSQDRELNRNLRRISRILEDSFDHDSMARLVRALRRDAADLDDVLDENHVAGSASKEDALTQLHVLRLALIQYIHLKAMDIPQFSTKLEVSLATLVQRLMHLDVPDTLESLRGIFPATAAGDDADVYGETDSYTRIGPSGYAAEHAEVFDPIEKAHFLILELSALIALHVGAYG